MGTKLQTDEAILDPTINLRFANWDDLSAVTQLIYDVCEADGDTSVAVTEEELAVEWKSPGFNLETDGIVAVTDDGHIVGYEEFFNVHEHAKLRTDGYVHPKFKGLGIRSSTLRLIEGRARKEIALAEPDVRVYLHSTIDSNDKDDKSSHEHEEYSPIRFAWRMQTDLESPPPPVDWPKGIELRPFIRDEHASKVWEAQNEAFRDHWGSHDIPFEQWELSKFGQSDFNPLLWVVAWDGDQIAGAAQNRHRMGIGWVSNLGVRRPWRKMGLGYALLTHSFGEFYKRGTKTIGLTVDAQSPTGATRLYKKAGMYTVSEYITYEKELRPGRSLE